MALADISACSLEDVPKFLHEVVDGICQRTDPRCPTYGKTWTIGQWRGVVRAYTALLRKSASASFDLEAALKAGGVATDYIKSVRSCAAARKEELRTALIEETVGLATASLADFDWRLQLALSSDRLSSLEETLLHVSLTVREVDGSSRVVNIELSHTELKDLIANLEAAKKVTASLQV